MDIHQFLDKANLIISNLENWQFLLQGAIYSFIIASIAWIMGIIIGIIGASCKLSHHKWIRFIGNVYVEIIRGTPMLLQILFWYLGVPTIYTLMTGDIFRMNKYIIGTIAIGINSGAYSTELIRSGILGIDKGQFEACKTLGLSKWQMMRFVILPQAFKQVVPPMVSEFITLIKDSSLLSAIGAVELLQSSQILGANYYNNLVPLLMASLFYLTMTFLISFIAKALERRLAQYD